MRTPTEELEYACLAWFHLSTLSPINNPLFFTQCSVDPALQIMIEHRGLKHLIEQTHLCFSFPSQCADTKKALVGPKRVGL